MAVTAVTELSGGVAVVTGGGSGLGAGLAEHAAAGLGMTVVVADKNEEAAGAVATALRERGLRAEPAVVDVGRSAAVQELAERVWSRWGRVDVLVNNAGIELHGRTWELPPERWRAVIDTNLNGVFHGMRWFLPKMLGQERRSYVINVASIAALSFHAHTSAYAATKHACLALSRSVADELRAADADIFVSTVMPGPVRTKIFDSSFSADDDGPGATDKSEMGRLLRRDGMDPPAAAEIIFAGALDGRALIHTHPEMSAAIWASYAQELTESMGGG